jgi:hypothetical protein
VGIRQEEEKARRNGGCAHVHHQQVDEDIVTSLGRISLD